MRRRNPQQHPGRQLGGLRSGRVGPVPRRDRQLHHLGNRARRGAALYDSSEPTYSCIQDWLGGGQGNLAFSPCFVDVPNQDFHLRSWSPCIDAGDPASPFANEPEPNGGRVNLGAYGNTPEAAVKSADTDADGLRTIGRISGSETRH